MCKSLTSQEGGWVTGLGEEGVERVVAAADRLVGRHLAVRLDAVLEAVELPAAITNLATALQTAPVSVQVSGLKFAAS